MPRWNEYDDYKKGRVFRDKSFKKEKGREHIGSHRRSTKYQERRTVQEQRAQPQPIDGKCNPLCPLFVCTKRAYKPRFDRETGRRYVFCTWIGDECIGASCQYAACRMNYLMPDGSCGWVKQKEMEKTRAREEFEEDFDETLEKRARSLLGRKYGKTSFDDYL